MGRRSGGSSPAVVYLHVEGDPRLRRGFSQFFQGIADLLIDRRIKQEVVMGGSNSETARGWRRDRQKERPAYLLIDAEGPAESGGKVPNGCRDFLNEGETVTGTVFYMVQVFESWYLLFPGQLEKWYGNGFDAKALPIRTFEKNPGPGAGLEEITKDRVYELLEKATKGSTGKQPFRRERSPSKLALAQAMLPGMDLVPIADASWHVKRMAEVLSRFSA